MKETDLLISCQNGVYQVKVAGRANFEYAVPLRELAKTLDTDCNFRIDLRECVAMDSTFMGVLSMIGLKAMRSKGEIRLLNASSVLQKLLRDLGVSRLFLFTEGELNEGDLQTAGASATLLTTAETVAEAHETLVETDSSNAAAFDQVIEFARQDVERLKNKEQK